MKLHDFVSRSVSLFSMAEAYPVGYLRDSVCDKELASSYFARTKDTLKACETASCK